MSENERNKNQGFTNSYQQYPYYYYPQFSPAYYPAYDPRQMPQSPQNQQNQQAQQQQQADGMGQLGTGQLPMEQSYIENILRLNEGKAATVYMTFENNSQWNAKVFRGIVEAAGRDHIILSDPQSGKRYLLLMIYLDYVTFDEEINYSYPYGNGESVYPSR
ncbi:spore germination protein Q [Virgibacillus subterraneus]|uniref:Spore germination protein Q n=2 Tax=Virgibacillus TaxID=84406 RepID=A0A1H0YAW6_9BACI|nr:MULTISPECIES: spore coat protein GerQ [Virgibacillus]SDQ12335.1 spore germination protein Q [Virgibacillus salinus]SEP71691.1 spore germination protein Q [Virgibacillus subterraneus]